MGKRPFLEITTFTDLGQSHHLLFAFCSCDWPNILNSSYAANIFISLYHFSINFSQFNHSEDGDSTFLRNVGTFSNHITYKRKQDYHLTKNPRGSQKTYTNKHVRNAFDGDISCCHHCDNEVCSPPNGLLKGHRWVRYWC